MTRLASNNPIPRFLSPFLLLLGMLFYAAAAFAGVPPNIVIIFLDDSGWSDFHPFGNPPYATPNVERLAAEGCRYNSFFVPQAVCSASRAALLTGCYPERTNVFGALRPEERGLDPKFATLAEVLKKRGYKTGIFGKWHVGDQPETRPTARGFDESAGLMYSNDMWDANPTLRPEWKQYPLQYWENGVVTCNKLTSEFQKTLTSRSAAQSIDFIQRHKADSFLLYVPFSMPHVPLFCSDAFKGKSGAGLYGDVILELDDSIGKIMASLKSNGLEENTIVIMSSDNGPWAAYGNHAGRTPFREAKATSFDGGTQSALIIKYPGKIKAGSSSDAMFCSVDLLPTLCQLTGTPLPENKIDGKDVWPLISGQPEAKNPHAYYPVTLFKNLEAVMSGDGRWKLHFPHDYEHVAVAGMDGAKGKYEKRSIEMSLFDLENDPRETTNVISQHPEVADLLKRLSEEHKKNFPHD